MSCYQELHYGMISFTVRWEKDPTHNKLEEL